MLSILIPTYNYACAHLVCELQKQCEEVQASLQGFDYEIIVAEDGSTDYASVEKNAAIEYLPKCSHEIREENVGRARIRNFLVRKARYKWVLIIDSDATIISDDFILRYWQAVQELAYDCAKEQSDGSVSCPPPTNQERGEDCEQTASTFSSCSLPIIIGGLSTPAIAPSGCELRHRYELAAEKVRTVEARSANPAQFFSTFNFLSPRSVLLDIPFDERCAEYGYEDALFGLEAERHGYRIEHIDNPLMHLGINSNANFLANSEAALRMLKLLGPPMTDNARVACVASSFTRTPLRRSTLRPLLLILYKMCRRMLRRNLLSSNPSLQLFAFYKLGYYLSLK